MSYQPPEPYQPPDPTKGSERPPSPPPPPPPPSDSGEDGWKDRVTYSEDGGFAYRPNELIVMALPDLGANDGDAPLQVNQARALIKSLGPGFAVEDPERVGPTAWRIFGRFDAEIAAAELRSVGIQADPNYVMFVHGYCCNPCGGYGFGANPLNANPLNANPLNANPLNANPLNANPLNANPLNANPLNANPLNANPLNANPLNANPLNANPLNANPLNANFRLTGIRPTSALPSKPPERRELTKIPTPSNKHKAIVIDTGITEPGNTPDLLKQKALNLSIPADYDPTDIEPKDEHLDPASGHGTFISGIIEQLAPGRVVRSARAINTLGEVDVRTAAGHLQFFIDNDEIDEYTIVNLSFGGYADSNMPMLAAAIARVQARGGVVVASAGNDGSCRPSLPAALPGVVSVGSIEPWGPAPYSNHGGWVRACAPGSSVISAFYEHFDGPIEVMTGGAPGDPDEYNEWANWTGTSFAAPIVVAALLRHMALTSCDAKTAVAEIIDDPRLFRFPGLGTVINLVP